jgi:hypothetical protein
MVNESTNEEIEQNWLSVWKEILEKPDGSIDKEQLKKELMDFSDMINRMASLTSNVTDGRMSYSTYPVYAILEQMVEAQEEEREYQRNNDLEDGECSMCGSEIGKGK